MLAGGKLGTYNSNYYLYTGELYWLGAPFFFNNDCAHEFHVYSSGDLHDYGVWVAELGVRPSISLKPGFSIIGNGDGSENNPYIVG